MKLYACLALAIFAGPVAAAPVHISLKTTAAVSGNADGFFTLGAVADVTGGETSLRTRLAGILIGRAPLSGENRRVTRGDLALKLRQAGCDPEKAAVLEGADAAEVTSQEPAGAAPTPSPSPGTGEGSRKVKSYSPLPLAAPSRQASVAEWREGPGVGAASPLIHRGDVVTIIIQSGPLTINAPAIARENGSAGQTIRVHREGVMTDLAVQVLDAQTVQLEI